MGREYVSPFTTQSFYSLIQSQVPNKVCWWLLNTKQTQESRKKNLKRGFFLARKATGTDWVSHGKSAATAHFRCSTTHSKNDFGPFLKPILIGTILCSPPCQTAPTHSGGGKRCLILINQGKLYVHLLLLWNCEHFSCPKNSLTAVLVRAVLTEISSWANE